MTSMLLTDRIVSVAATGVAGDAGAWAFMG
jgi:hypothetical protein